MENEEKRVRGRIGIESEVYSSTGNESYAEKRGKGFH